MKTTTFAITAAVLMLGSASSAQAQRYTNYPVCAVYSQRTVSCAFDTMAQCYMTVSGRGGFCELNWAYQPPAQTKRRKKTS
jgi:hypothetical protein